MEREACVCDHGYERSDLCAEIIIIIILYYCKRSGLTFSFTVRTKNNTSSLLY